MWQRIVRLLTAFFNAYSFYSNPVGYILGLLAVLIVPYLVYIFWGTLIVIGLMALGIYFIYRLLTRNRRKRTSS